MKVTLKKARGLVEWMQVYRLYRQAFPRSEQKPFSIIFKMAYRGTTDVWCMKQHGRFVGFATTINGSKDVLLDYLAVKPSCRGGGVGGKTLLALQAQYRGRGFFVEIEDPFKPGPDQQDRIRRKNFYRTYGMEPFGVMACVFGVDMELLGRDCYLDFDAYQAFYRENYSPWAAQHLEARPYPKT